MLSKANRIKDALGNLEHELSTMSTLTFMLWDKAHYFLNLSEDAAKSMQQAQEEYKSLKEALDLPE